MVACTVVQVQPGVLVIGWQVVAPDGLFTAIPLKAGNGPTSSCALFCIQVVEDHESGQDAPIIHVGEEWPFLIWGLGSWVSNPLDNFHQIC